MKRLIALVAGALVASLDRHWRLPQPSFSWDSSHRRGLPLWQRRSRSNIPDMQWTDNTSCQFAEAQ